MRKLLPVLLLFFMLSCKDNRPALVTSCDYFNTGDTGVLTAGIRMLPVQTPVGTYKVWTKRFGNNPTTKVLLLHGGPAMTHEYMEAFESFFPQANIEFYEYDQLGSYYSDQPTDSSLWTIDRFVDEVEQVRKALKLDSSNFFLLGNSWGGMLAMEYALKYQQHLKGLIICNMMASCPDYDKYAKEVLAKQMDPKILDTIKHLEATNDFQNPKYFELLMPNFYKQHICRLEEWPDPVNRALKHVNGTVYTLMQGPSEFGIGGRLANWDRKADLPKITVPTLTVGATHDTMDPEHMRWMSTQVKQGQYLHCPNGSHLSIWDDQQVFMNGVIKFINGVSGAH
ncbi:MAG: proline iminopeptidase-family hydrolase [Pseudobacter sp.]|uniref:proline iminopeptidase-family hydrolase n=1 Tax=Pseudobacter sp. TaxID=2045420 RepID=UPI003F7D8113